MDKEVSTSPMYHHKDFDTYGSTTNNFVDNQELTVTITLNEYRELVQEAANADKDKVQNDLWKAQSENTDLKTQNKLLMQQLQEKSVADATATDSEQDY